MFANLQFRHQALKVKWEVSLMIAGGQFNLPWALCVYVWVNMLTLSSLKGLT